MNEIVEFLLARLAEDERVVRYASVNAHRPALHLDGNGYVVVDPTRVLAEVEAKRRIVWAVTDWLDTHPDEDHVPAGDDALCWLALPYADHEHYRSEWRP